VTAIARYRGQPWDTFKTKSARPKPNRVRTSWITIVSSQKAAEELRSHPARPRVNHLDGSNKREILALASAADIRIRTLFSHASRPKQAAAEDRSCHDPDHPSSIALSGQVSTGCHWKPLMATPIGNSEAITIDNEYVVRRWHYHGQQIHSLHGRQHGSPNFCRHREIVRTATSISGLKMKLEGIQADGRYVSARQSAPASIFRMKSLARLPRVS